MPPKGIMPNLFGERKVYIGKDLCDMKPLEPAWFSDSITDEEGLKINAETGNVNDLSMFFPTQPVSKKTMDVFRKWLKDGTKIHNLATNCRKCRVRGLNIDHADMSYDTYKTLQEEAHSVFHCNLKRALKEYRCKLKIRYMSKNGHWLWMK